MLRKWAETLSLGILMTDQKVNRSENVVQIAGNAEINNQYGLTVNEVRELTGMFMRENFPVLRAEAINAAQVNVNHFLLQFEQKIAQSIGNIDPTRFKDPDIQSSLNDAVIETAKKGSRSNPEILVELVTERLNLRTNDYVSLVVSEAIRVVPRLTPEQIAFLTLVLFLKKTKHDTAKSFNDFLPLASIVLEVSRCSFGLSDSKKSHLEFTGCVKVNGLLSVSIYEIWKANYGFIKEIPDEELKNTIELDYPILHELAKAFSENKLEEMTISSVGQVIAIANLSKRMPGLDFANWVN